MFLAVWFVLLKPEARFMLESATVCREPLGSFPLSCTVCVKKSSDACLQKVHEQSAGAVGSGEQSRLLKLQEQVRCTIL